MIKVLASSWALLLGMLLLMVGNGLQGTLLGVRGGLEGFTTLQMSLVMSAYFLGFLGGSRMAPEMIRRVGHVRVFAALGSFISAVLILYPAITDPWAWTLLRVIIGFCFSGVYVTAESWLNNAATNETRGQALSLYMIVQMAGIVAAQGLLTLGDPSGFILFIIPSVLVSISFAPILLSVSPTPPFETTKPMSIRALYHVSPLGCVGAFLLGGVYSALFGMAAVYGTQSGLSVAQISAFVAAIYVGGLLMQFPIGWMSDRMDRRQLILGTAVLGCVGALAGLLFESRFSVLLGAMFVVGGTSNPLYALIIAYTNDFLEHEDMAAASGGMIFLNGVGAVAGPLITGWIMGYAGPSGFFLFLAALLGSLSAYAAYRMTQRRAPLVSETGTYSPVLPSATSVAVEAAQEVFIEGQEEEHARHAIDAA
ncbi:MULTISPECIES: MFS transporter [Actibacterium]|uniref:MFS family permease n=1 Tax=Actibacterium naphthalenivorans TaxID=1614693 RepID=A0A840CDE8_9RHOB|nr:MULTISPECIES: MFS transporter [Actibacterium]ALG90600.1 major facilitator transporter [Actibacterium sp. EMB200-NS6]MBB4023230.1 MFS family permease [Actibacterium naphthalenivorans]